MGYQIIWPKIQGKLRGDLPSVTQGSTLETLTIGAFYSDGTGVSLTGKTITATATDEAGNTTSITGTLTGGASQFTWALSEGDIGTDGTYTLIVTYTDGVKSWASDPARFTVLPNPAADSVQNPALVGIGADDAAWVVASAAGGLLGELAYIDDADSDGTQYARKNGAWEAVAASGSDVGDLTTAGLDATNMLRVAAAGGLEERTPAQVLGDIGAEAAGAAASRVAKAGDTMTGALVLSGAPTIDLHAATKKYVDDNGGGGYGTNVVIVNGAGGADYTTLSAALAAITTASAANRFLVIVRGNVAEIATITAKNYIDVFFVAGAVVTVTISSGYALDVLSLVSTIWSAADNSQPHIIRAGTAATTNGAIRFSACTNGVKFSSIYVQNTVASTGSSFGIYSQSSSVHEMIECIGKAGGGNDGYGITNNVASPYMRDCIGYGSDGGNTGHGINNSFSSCPTMISCRGYGGSGGTNSRGINNAYASNPYMLECVGVGGPGSAGSGIFYNNNSLGLAVRCIGVGGGAIAQQATATITASARQDDAFRPTASYPYRLVAVTISVTTAAAAGVTLEIRDATGGAGNVLVAAQAVDTTGTKYTPVSGHRIISAGNYAYGRLSAADSTLAYTVIYNYELCSNQSYGLFMDSNAPNVFQDCTFFSNADSETIYVSANGIVASKFIGGTARSGRNDGTRKKAFYCAAAWNPGQVYNMVLDGGSTNLTAAAGTANGSNIEL